MIYAPSDDSFLLEEQVKKLSKNKKVLDVGTGSGIQALAAKDSGAKEVLAVDIDEESIKAAKKKNLQVVRSNLFQKVKGRFDLIIFNPPYLPLDEKEDSESAKATTGGKKGDEIILKFLKEAPKHLQRKGNILLLISSLTPKNKIIKSIKKNKLSFKVLSEKKLFFENLEVWEIHS